MTAKPLDSAGISLVGRCIPDSPAGNRESVQIKHSVGLEYGYDTVPIGSIQFKQVYYTDMENAGCQPEEHDAAG